MIPPLLGSEPGCGSTQVGGRARSGSSGAEVHIFDCADGSCAAVKVAASPRVSALRQEAARAQIAPFFGERLPRVLYAGRHQDNDVLITECPAPQTFADAACDHGPTPDLLATWTQIVDQLVTVWQQSTQPGYEPDNATRNHQRRLHRAIDGLTHAFDTLGTELSVRHRFIVNGADLGTCAQLQRRLAALPPPTFRVACLGDPQPTNVLLTPQLHWYLIDWEWAGHHHDWRMMASHLLGWWFVEDILAHTRGTVTTRDDHVTLDYPPPDLTAVRPWLARPTRAFHAMTTRRGHDRDHVALCLHMAMLLLREIPRTTARDSHQLAPLLGEALRLVEAAHHGPPHPLQPAFAPFSKDSR